MPAIASWAVNLFTNPFASICSLRRSSRNLRNSPKSEEELLPRAPYWKEFDQSDPRRGAIDQLGLLLGPQWWLTQDVARHLDWLIPWEIRRATAADDSWKQLDETPPIDFAGWEIVRDNLVSFWDWWADGVHLRPQPFRPRGKTSPYVVRLAEEIAPTDLPRIQLPELVRVTTIGAHIGDALFQLNCIVHFEINKATGWLGHQSVFVVDEREAPFRFEGFADTNSDT
jgi:hypothetical protein